MEYKVKHIDEIENPLAPYDEKMRKICDELANESNELKKGYGIRYFIQVISNNFNFNINDHNTTIGSLTIEQWYNYYKRQYFIKINQELLKKYKRLSKEKYYNKIKNIIKEGDNLNDFTELAYTYLKDWYKWYLQYYLSKYNQIRPKNYNFKDDEFKYLTGYKNRDTNKFIFESQNQSWHPNYNNIKLPKFNNFPYKNNRKYQLKFIGNDKEYQMDLFYSGNYCYLLAIEVPSRYLFSSLTNLKLNDKEFKKTSIAIYYAIKHLYRNYEFYPEIIYCDKEPAFFSDLLKYMLWEVDNVKVYPVQRIKINNKISYPIHSSLAIIDRVCRTIRDMADNLSLDIIDPYNMEKIVWNYNHAPHRTLTKKKLVLNKHLEFIKNLIILELIKF